MVGDTVNHFRSTPPGFHFYRIMDQGLCGRQDPEHQSMDSRRRRRNRKNIERNTCGDTSLVDTRDSWNTLGCSVFLCSPFIRLVFGTLFENMERFDTVNRCVIMYKEKKDTKEFL